jgi:hypothetical protein
MTVEGGEGMDRSEERFLSAQADPLAEARGEEEVSLLRSK